MTIEKLRMIVLSSLMAALMAVGAYIHIPIGPVPIVITNLFVLLSGLLLGSRWGIMSTALYILLGAIGLPVFYGGKGGLAHLFGPTGGYLFGFMIASWATGFISARFGHLLVSEISAVIIGSLLIYVFGILWLKILTQMTFYKTLTMGMFPFILGDTVKAIMAISMARVLRPILNRQLTQMRRCF